MTVLFNLSMGYKIKYLSYAPRFYNRNLTALNNVRICENICFSELVYPIPYKR
jgi:hypothetical protein